MSVDPLSAAFAANADPQALIDAELAQLAADAQALRGLLVEDAVVTARVLPSNGLTDLLEIAGRRVAASLPPTVRPGDVLQVRVSGFDGGRILLQIVGTGADAAVEAGPGTPLPPPPLVSPQALPAVATPAAAAGGPESVEPSNVPSSPPPIPPATGAATPAVGGGSARPDPARTPVPLDPAAPPDVERLAPPAAGRPGAAGAFTSVAARANVEPVQPGRAAAAPIAPAAGIVTRPPIAGPVEPTTIEARVAAARASLGVRAVEDELESDLAGPPRTAGGARFTLPPPIAPRGAANAPAAPVRPIPGQPHATGLSAYAEPVALLRALRLPVTPSNVSAATLALQRPERLPDALAALERALPRASDDPNVATLRTLLSFVGRIEPRSPALAGQIAAFVDHVVDGTEPKVATLLAAIGSAAEPAAAASDPSDASGAPSSRSVAAAVAVERGAALSGDLKQLVLSIAANPDTPGALAPALTGALTALTAVQLNAAQALAARPDGIAFVIPLTTPFGTSNAQVSIQRDAPDGRGGTRVDPENFRIAFVLETAHYGTIAIDLVTVGREVTVDVRTQAAPAMRAFRDALGGLTTRLESLRYRVAAAGASLGTVSTVAVEAPPARAADPDAAVDRSA